MVTRRGNAAVFRCPRSPRAKLAFAQLVALLLAALALPAASSAALLTVGSPLSRPATLNTAEDLNYKGTDTPVGPSPEYPNGAIVHTYHFAADDALWNTSIGGADASMPASGQAVRVRLEGCAEPAASGPAPLTQFHLQSLSPVAGGGARVDLSSQAFNIPVCGAGGGSGSTITTFEPINLCVDQGGFVAFNDEGGWVPHVYQSGVPYRVFARAAGSSFNSFLRANGTNNGDILSPGYTTNMDGFVQQGGQELMLQVILGTGPDARYVCPGGTKDAPPVLSALSVHPQTAGVGRRRVVAVTIYCRPASGCSGTAALTVGAKHLAVGHTAFNLAGGRSTSVPIHVKGKLLSLLLHAHGHRLGATVTATMGSTTATSAITLKLNAASIPLSRYSRRGHR
jgi:hypothetical protein